MLDNRQIYGQSSICQRERGWNREWEWGTINEHVNNIYLSLLQLGKLQRRTQKECQIAV